MGIKAVVFALDVESAGVEVQRDVLFNGGADDDEIRGSADFDPISLSLRQGDTSRALNYSEERDFRKGGECQTTSGSENDFIIFRGKCRGTYSASRFCRSRLALGRRRQRAVRAQRRLHKRRMGGGGCEGIILHLSVAAMDRTPVSRCGFRRRNVFSFHLDFHTISLRRRRGRRHGWESAQRRLGCGVVEEPVRLSSPVQSVSASAAQN